MRDETKRHTVPLGDTFKAAFAALDFVSREKADALAAAAVRYAVAGEEPPAKTFPPETWDAIAEETNRIRGISNVRRAAALVRWNAKGDAKGDAKGMPSREEEEEEEDTSRPIDTENRRPSRPVDTRAPVRAAPPPTSTDFGISPPSASTDFASWAWAQKDPVKVALRASGEGADKAPVYGAKWRDLKSWRGEEDGRRRFVEECIAFRSELDAGEPCENPGRALVARLNKLIEDAEAEFRADAPLPGMIDNFAAGFKETVASLSASKRVNTDA